jgi:hypothetical protein
MKPVKYIIYSIAIWVFFYLAFAFVWVNINPFQWREIIRAFFVVLCTFINIMMITYPRNNKS